MHRVARVVGHLKAASADTAAPELKASPTVGHGPGPSGGGGDKMLTDYAALKAAIRQDPRYKAKPFAIRNFADKSWLQPRKTGAEAPALGRVGARAAQSVAVSEAPGLRTDASVLKAALERPSVAARLKPFGVPIAEFTKPLSFDAAPALLPQAAGPAAAAAVPVSPPSAPVFDGVSLAYCTRLVKGKSLARFADKTGADGRARVVTERWVHGVKAPGPLGVVLKGVRDAVDAGDESAFKSAVAVLNKHIATQQLPVPPLTGLDAAIVRKFRVRDDEKGDGSYVVLSEEHTSFWGTARQLLYGQVASDIMTSAYLWLHPFVAVLVNPTGGIVGPGDDDIEDKALFGGVVPGVGFLNLGGEKSRPALAYHGVVHDAAGYCLNAWGVGPGYFYRDGAPDEGNPQLEAAWYATLTDLPFDESSPYAFQLGGIHFWRAVLNILK